MDDEPGGDLDQPAVGRRPSRVLRVVTGIAAAALAVTALGVLIGDDEPRNDTCRIPIDVFDRRYELSVFLWEDATDDLWEPIERALEAKGPVRRFDRISLSESDESYAAYVQRTEGLMDPSYIAPQLLVDLGDLADLRGVVAALEARREVRHVEVHCAGYRGDGDGMPQQSECPPYDLLFLLTPVVTPAELAAFEERFTTDPRVASHRFVSAEDTPDGRAPQYAVELSSDLGTGAPPADDTEVREDIGRLRGTEFVLERPRCQPDG